MMPKDLIYLDHQATTPVDPRVLEAMLPWFKERFGNAASKSHAYGWEAEEAVEAARAQVAALIGASPEEIVFTSGATESNNLALKGAAEAHPGRHLVTVATEHRSVLDSASALERKGWRVTRLPVGPDGIVDLDEVRDSLTGDTALLSVMAANNEIGVLQPLKDIGGIVKERGVLFHSDAAQALGKEPLDVKALGVGLMSLSAHKICGPKGVGALYVRRRPRSRLVPQMDGGGHERGLRSGTLNVPAIVGFGKACGIAATEMGAERERTKVLRDRLRSRLGEARLNGHPELRLAGNLNLSFEGVDGEALLSGLKDVAVSSGSACTSASLEPSHVLKALGIPDALAHASLRFGIGRFTTEAEVDEAARRVVRHVKALRKGTRKGAARPQEVIA